MWNDLSYITEDEFRAATLGSQEIGSSYGQYASWRAYAGGDGVLVEYTTKDGHGPATVWFRATPGS